MGSDQRDEFSKMMEFSRSAVQLARHAFTHSIRSDLVSSAHCRLAVSLTARQFAARPWIANASASKITGFSLRKAPVAWHENSLPHDRRVASAGGADRSGSAGGMM